MGRSPTSFNSIIYRISLASLLLIPSVSAWGGQPFIINAPDFNIPPPPPPPPREHRRPCIWLEWTTCDASCNGGLQIRNRFITDKCPFGPSQEERVCNTQPCPQNAVLSEWSDWNCGAGCCGCSAPCGGGLHTRVRTVITPPLFGGECGDVIQTEACNTQPCPTDCVVTSSWSSWRGCSVPCGGGYENRSRTFDLVVVARAGVSQTEANCPNFLEERACNVVACPIDCVLTDWSSWTGCSTPGAISYRFRQPSVYPQNGGQDCDAALIDSQPCGAPPQAAPPIFVPPPAYPSYGYPSAPLPPPPPPPQAAPPIAPPPAYPSYPSAPLPPPPPPQAAPPIAPPPAYPSYGYPSAPLPPPPPPPPPPPADVPVPPPPAPSFCSIQPDGIYPKPGCQCCNDFILCFQRSQLVKYCPDNQVFDGSSSKCIAASACY